MKTNENIEEKTFSSPVKQASFHDSRIVRNVGRVLDYLHDHVVCVPTPEGFEYLPDASLSFLRVRLKNDVTYMFTSKSRFDIYSWLYLHQDDVKHLILRYYETLH